MGCTSSDQNAVVEPNAKYSPKERVPTPRGKVSRRTSASASAASATQTRKLSNATSVSSAPSGFRAAPSRNDSTSYGPAQFSPYNLSPRAQQQNNTLYDPYGYPADALAHQQQLQSVYPGAPSYAFPYSQYPPAPIASPVEAFGQGDVSVPAPDPIALPASVSTTQQASRSNTAGFFGSGSVFSHSSSAPHISAQQQQGQNSPSSKRKKLNRSQSTSKSIQSPRRPERVQARWKERRMRLASASGQGVDQSDDEVAHGAMRRNSSSTSKIVAALDVLKVPQDAAEAQFYAAHYPKSSLTTANAESSDVSD